MQSPSNESPVSFPVDVARLPAKGMPVVIEADARQRAALAQAHDLEAVDAYRAELTVSKWRRNGVSVQGRVVASVVQLCVVTLEPMVAEIDEAISSVFLPEDSKLGRQGFDGGGEIVIDVDGPDSPETFSGTQIDVGALAEEFFGLGIDPYPRKPGAVTDFAAEASDTEDTNDVIRRQLKRLLPGS